MSRRLVILAVAAAPLALVAAASPATAKDHGFVHVVSPPFPDPLNLYPGASTAQTLWVQNKYGAVADLRLQATNVVELENGCAHSEREVDDCDDDTGELGGWLRMTITRNSPDGELTMWSGTFEELQQGIALAPRLPAGGRPELRIVTTMDREAGNDTMTDRVTYDLRFTLTSTQGSNSATVPMDSGGKSLPPSRLASFVQSMDEPSLQVVTWTLLGALALTSRLARRRRKFS